MSFHGGMLGVIFAMWLFRPHAASRTGCASPTSSRRSCRSRSARGASATSSTPSSGAGPRTCRGRWSFPNVDSVPRHPSQLYEFALEGVVLFLLLWWFSSKPRPRGAVSGSSSSATACFASSWSPRASRTVTLGSSRSVSRWASGFAADDRDWHRADRVGVSQRRSREPSAVSGPRSCAGQFVRRRAAYRLKYAALRGGSSAGRASRSQCEGREFDPPPLHHLRIQQNPTASTRRRFSFCTEGKRSPTKARKVHGDPKSMGVVLGVS